MANVPPPGEPPPVAAPPVSPIEPPVPDDLFVRPRAARPAGAPIPVYRVRRPRSSANPFGWLESLIVGVTDPRWWGWLGGPRSSGGRRRPAIAPPGAPPPPPMVIPGRPIPVTAGLATPMSIPDDEELFLPAALWNRLVIWLREQGRYHVVSMIVHVVVVVTIGLLAGNYVASTRSNEPTFDTSLDGPPPSEFARFKLGDAPLDPTVLDTAALEELEPQKMEQLEQINDDSPVFEEKGGGQLVERSDDLGGLGGFDVKALGAGPVISAPGGIGSGVGEGEQGGHGGAGSGFGSRGAGRREAMVGAGGGTRESERAVAAALNWFARHQNTDGSWSLDHYDHRCKDKTCTGPGEITSDAAGTALALLPFLAADQTHQSKGPYQKTVRSGLQWLVNNQQSDGCLAARNSFGMMYTHGIASIAVCEAYGLTHDPRLGSAAESAIHYIEQAQNSGGGWRYVPGQPGDTSVVGWQVMALKSAQMAGIKVSDETMKGAKKFLLSTASGSAGSEFGYLPGEQSTPSMTAVGLLCSQYLGAARDDAVMQRGMKYLLAGLPTDAERDCYYWYYGTQVMHNLPGHEWDVWNRQMRTILIKSQESSGCATGSWNPIKPKPDSWGSHGGRLMQTSLSTLCIEVYYRYLPLYKLDTEPGEAKPSKAAAAGDSGSNDSASK